MKVFILKVLYFLLPITALSVAADFAISRSLQKSKTYASGEYSTWNDIYNGRIESDIVIYGSSRAVVQIDPMVLQDSLQSSCYNLGIDGLNFHAQYFRHGLFIASNRKPRIIIHSLDATTLEERGNLFNADQFLPYMLFDRPIESFANQYNAFSYFDYRIPLLRYLGKRDAILHAARLFVTDQAKEQGRIRGYQGQERSWNNDLLLAKQQLSTYEIKIDSVSLSLFRRYLEFCNQENIKVVLVYSPQHNEGQHFITNLDAILAMYKDFSIQYQVPFIDYSADPMCSDKSFFYNSGHLNKMGSQLFSAKLASDLKNRGLSY